MKKILILLISIIMLSCIDNQNKYIKEYGIVTSIEIYQKYDPLIHIYNDAYKIGVQFPDTFAYIMDGNQPQLGDTIIRYINMKQKDIRVKPKVDLNDYEM